MENLVGLENGKNFLETGDRKDYVYSFICKVAYLRTTREALFGNMIRMLPTPSIGDGIYITETAFWQFLLCQRVWHDATKKKKKKIFVRLLNKIWRLNDLELIMNGCFFSYLENIYQFQFVKLIKNKREREGKKK